MAEMLLKEKQQKEKQIMRSAALHAWLTGAAPKKTYEEYLKIIGLSDELKPEEKRINKEESLKKSNAVIDKLNKLRGKTK